MKMQQKAQRWVKIMQSRFTDKNKLRMKNNGYSFLTYFQLLAISSLSCGSDNILLFERKRNKDHEDTAKSPAVSNN